MREQKLWGTNHNTYFTSCNPLHHKNHHYVVVCPRGVETASTGREKEKLRSGRANDDSIIMCWRCPVENVFPECDNWYVNRNTRRRRRRKEIEIAFDGARCLCGRLANGANRIKYHATEWSGVGLCMCCAATANISVIFSVFVIGERIPKDSNSFCKWTSKPRLRSTSIEFFIIFFSLSLLFILFIHRSHSSVRAAASHKNVLSHSIDIALIPIVLASS